jgi:cytoskeletal protein RodZ
MGELGNNLRQAREAKGLTLEQAEEATKIRSAYLQALEEERYDLMPAPVYVKGFLKNYAQFLGLDAKEIVSLYQQPTVSPATTSVPTLLDQPLEPVGVRQWWPLLLIPAIIAAVAVGWWGYQRYFGATPTPTPTATPSTLPTAAPSDTAVPPSPTVSSAMANSASATPSPTHTVRPTATSSATPTASPTPTAISLQLSVEVVGDRSWLLVQGDGQRLFAGILEPGAKDSWTARERIALRSGNAGAIRVTLNGEDLGLFGEVGQVVEKEWTAPGVPTSTPEPTTAG